MGNARKMRALFLQQVDAGALTQQALPHHRTAAGSGREPAESVVLRVAQWNVNCLCGADGLSPQCAASFLEVLQVCNADVVLLQEVPAGPPDENWPEPWRSMFPTREMRALEAGMLELGYHAQLRTHAGNSTMLCSKLPVERCLGSINLDDDHCFRHLMKESRAALMADVRLPPTLAGDESGTRRRVSFFATHLHHDNMTRGPDGVRGHEAVALLRHWHENASPHSACCVLATDFNQARCSDYSDGEWAVIAAGLAKPWVRQPEDDGVAHLLRGAGWHCAYDSASAARNWSGQGAPPLTHWTGTVVDYPYFADHGGRAEILGTYVVYTSLSDHLPIVTDIRVTP